MNVTVPHPSQSNRIPITRPEPSPGEGGMQPWYALQVSREGFLNHGMDAPPLGYYSEPVGLLSEGVLGVVGPMPSTLWQTGGHR